MQSIILAFLFAAVLSGTNGVNAQYTCYNCTYSTMTMMGLTIEYGDKACKDPIDTTGIQTVSCAGSCAKSIVSGADDLQSMGRTCYTDGVCMNFENMELMDMIMNNYCCTGSNCNTAGVITFSVTLGITSVFSTFLL